MPLESPLESHVAPQFGTAEAQAHAAQFGMWIFLATEVLLFGGLFVCYAVYRFIYGDAFAAIATKEMELGIGTINTFVLLGSSIFVAMADVLIRHNRRKSTAACLMVAVVLGIVFICLKALEYKHHVNHGALPGKWYHLAELPTPGAVMFMTLYFLMTGLHAVHLTVAVCLLTFVAWNTLAGEYSATYHTPVEVTGMYWHLVDVIWVFLYPLFYLLAK